MVQKSSYTKRYNAKEVKKSSDPSPELCEALRIANLIRGSEVVRSGRMVATEVADVVAYLLGIPGCRKPSESELERYRYLVPPDELWPGNLMNRGDEVEEVKRWRSQLESYPDLFRHLSAGLSSLDSEEDRKIFDDRFQEFERIRELVHRVAIQAERFRERRDEPMSFEMPLNVRIDGTDGRIRINTNWYVDAFHGVDLAKLHRCKAVIKTADARGRVGSTECNNVFWQKPAHKRACSKECSNKLSGRKYRQKSENVQKAKDTRSEYGAGNHKRSK